MTADPFDVPARDIPRDRWGRPMVYPPGGKKPVPYTRCTTYVGVLEDTYNLSRWQQRMVALGLADRPDLMLAVAAHRDERDKLNEICGSALDAAKAGAAATTGTALHALTEKVDRDLPLGVIPEAYIADLEQYRETTAPLTVKAIEQFRVLDSLKIGGTTDRVVEYLGRYYIADVKGLALTTPLPTPDGWTTMAAVEVGDEVFGADGRPCRVVIKSETKRIGTYIVRFDDGSAITCDTEHIWWTAAGCNRTARPTAKSVGEVAATLTYQGQNTHRVPVAGALDLPDADLPIDPYLLGCWLGDGAARGGTITKTADLFDILISDGHKLGVEQVDARNGIITRTVLGLTVQLREADLLHNKHVPDRYLRASIHQRLQLLAGLMDTDGTWNTARRRAGFISTDKRLALAVEELLASLGQRPHLAEHQATGYGKTVTAYLVEFTPVDINPFRLPRKADQAAASTKLTTHARRRVIVAVEIGPDVETACIGVDSPDHTYLCGERMIPTHNTGSIDWGILKICMQLAVYSRSTPYDIETRVRTVDPFELDQDRAIVIHLPAGKGLCELKWVNIAAGWDAVQVAAQVRDWRARKDLAEPFDIEPASTATDFAPQDGFVAAATLAGTVDELNKIWVDATAAGAWNDDVLNACKIRKSQLLAGAA